MGSLWTLTTEYFIIKRHFDYFCFMCTIFSNPHMLHCEIAEYS